MKRLIVTLLAMAMSCSVFAQNREEMYEDFVNAVHKNDTSAMLSVISNWEKAYPDDAELYSLRTNYYLSNAIREDVGLSDQAPTDGRQYWVMTDSLGVNYYIFPELQIDSVRFNSAIHSLQEGISRYPDRSDLRLGKITVHLMVYDNEAAVEEIHAMLKYSKINSNKWLTSLDNPLEGDGESFLMECTQSFFGQLFDAGDMDSAERLSDVCIEEYPDKPVFLSDKAAIRYSVGDIDEALAYYLKARILDPADMLITDNIARLYLMQGDITNSIKYYKIVAESGDKNYADKANSILKDLEH